MKSTIKNIVIGALTTFCIALALEVHSLNYALKVQTQINQHTQAEIDSGVLIPHVTTHEYGARLGTNRNVLLTNR